MKPFNETESKQIHELFDREIENFTDKDLDFLQQMTEKLVKYHLLRSPEDIVQDFNNNKLDDFELIARTEQYLSN